MRWDLARVYTGGPRGAAVREAEAGLCEQLRALEQRVDTLGPLAEDRPAWTRTMLQLWELHTGIEELASYMGCYSSADTASEAARSGYARARDLDTALEQLRIRLHAGLDAAPAAAVESWLADEQAAELHPLIRHLQRGAALRLPQAEQALFSSLEREALHGWGDLYELINGRLEAEHPTRGSISIAQLAPDLAHPEEPVRAQALAASQAAWRTVQEECAMALTHLTGARQTLQDRLGVGPLASTLHRNRLQRSSLDAMWEAVDEVQPLLVRYLDRKAALLGKTQLDWHDLGAPLPVEGDELAWEAAGEQIVEAFAAFSEDLAAFAREALRRRWVDAESRSHRRPGGFCASFPLAEESRIFLTWGGNLRTATTLAHELGHAYHNHQLWKNPPSRRRIVNATAETASTFAEALFRDHALARAENPELRRAMLDQEALSGVSLLMNIRARYEFERQLYELRREGPLEPAALSGAMLACQRRAYGGALASYDPTFWASKLHFYISYFSFYNWPYTFGYLFSSAVYARAQEEGPAFRQRYLGLLRSTGYLTTEEAAEQVLGADPGDVAFWRGALGPLVTRVEDFLALTEASHLDAAASRSS